MSLPYGAITISGFLEAHGLDVRRLAQAFRGVDVTEADDIAPSAEFYELFGSTIKDISNKLAGYNVSPSDILDELLADTGFRIAWSNYQWLDSSRPVYDLSKELIDVFGRTRITVHGNEIILPFPGIYISLANGDNITVVDRGGKHLADKVNGIYVTRLPAVETHMIGIIIIGDRYVQEIDGDDGIIAPLKLGLISDEEEYETRFIEIRGSLSRQMSYENADNIIRIYRLVINTLLYLGSIEPDIEIREVIPDSVRNIRKPRRREQAIRRYRLNAPKVHYLGHRLSDSEQGRKLLEGHRVRAHLRWQRVGAGRKDIKLVVVRSHWRGPRDNPSQSTRVYQIDDGGQ